MKYCKNKIKLINRVFNFAFFSETIFQTNLDPPDKICKQASYLLWLVHYLMREKSRGKGGDQQSPQKRVVCLNSV